MLLLFNTFKKHHHTETLFIFTVFVPTSRLKSIYVYLWNLFFIFIFIFIMINRMNTDIFVLLLIFQNMSYYFWMITQIKGVNNFQIAKVQPQGVAWDLLNFFPISTWCCL